MYKIAICDDDINYIELLKKTILATNILGNNMLQFYEFECGEHLVYAQNLDYDLVIMDIQLEKMDGYESAMKLREIDSNFILVFCSGVFMPAPKFFKANAFRYLEKSATKENLQREMAEILKEMIARKKQPYIMCKYSRGKDQFRLYAESVLYIEKSNCGSTIIPYGKLKEVYPTQRLRTTKRLHILEEIFDEEHNFVRLHNSYLANMIYIMRVSGDNVEMIDGTVLTVSRSRKKNFHKKFAEFASSKYIG